MATYNSMATPASGESLGPGLNTSGAPIGMENFDGDMNFDDFPLDGVGGFSNMAFPPAIDLDSIGFEDNFAYPPRPNFHIPGASEAAASAAANSMRTGQIRTGHNLAGHSHSHNPAADVDAGFADPEASPQEALDIKLLSFSPPLAKAPLLDDSGQYVEPEMSAELYGMFFVAEDVFGGDNNPGSRPLELTCYRRNLWQCSGQISLPRHLLHVVTEQGLQLPVLELAASISAIESIEGKPTEVISIPWKSVAPAPGAGGGAVAAGTGDEHHKSAGPPPRIPLDLTAAAQELDGGVGRISLPVSWKRLQFKHATANNGRRKGLQQHYVVQISLLAKPAPPPAAAGARSLSDEFIKIAEIQSGPVIVRGRSPRNFDSRKDVPLSSFGDKRTERRSASSSEPPTAASPIRGDLSQNLQRYHSLGNVQQITDWPQSLNANNGGTGGQQPAGPQQPVPKKLALSPTLNRPPVPSWSPDPNRQLQQPPTPTKATVAVTGAASSVQRSSTSAAAALQTFPINLSLSEDERSPPNRENSESLPSPRFGSGGGAGRTLSSDASQGLNPITGSPLENADMLYEYFPLGLDSWMPLVDAIYRPHVVHHTEGFPEVEAQQRQAKSKRYFVAD